METTRLTPSFEQILHHERGPVVAVAFTGSYPPGSQGNDHAATMVAYLRYVLSATKPVAVLFDFRALEYTWGDAIGGLALALREDSTGFRPSAIVAGARTARALQPLLGPHLPFGIAGTKMLGSMPEAIAHLESALGIDAPGDAAPWPSGTTSDRQGSRLKAYWAYAFACDQPMEAILAAWNEAGAWQWQFRDSYWYGDYLNTRPVKGLRVRIHESPPRPSGVAPSSSAGTVARILRAFIEAIRHPQRYTALLQIEADSPATQPEIDGVLRGLLERIGAKKIRKIEPYD